MFQKLNSKQGASMIIAMVFMLLCIFVGGSVLTAATANASRAKFQARQQDDLNERSAATLIAGELKADDGVQLKLTVYEDASAIRFSVSGGRHMTGMQRMVFESAIRSYLLSAEKKNVIIEGFTYDTKNEFGGTVEKPVSDPKDFWIPQPAGLSGPVTGTFHLKGESGELSLADFDMLISCRDYNITVTFGENSSLKVTMPAYTGKKEIPAEDSSVLLTTVTVISWVDPKIEKGNG